MSYFRKIPLKEKNVFNFNSILHHLPLKGLSFKKNPFQSSLWITIELFDHFLNFEKFYNKYIIICVTYYDMNRES